jgi:ATP-dependent RNA helicase DeaD
MLLDLLRDCCGLSRKEVGQIDLKGAYSFFEVNKEKVQSVMEGFEGMEYRGRSVRVEVTDAKPAASKKGNTRSSKSFGKRKLKTASRW